MRGLNPETTGWIKRHFIGWQNATLPNIISHPKHAEKVVASEQKRGEMKRSGVFYDDCEEEYNSGLCPSAPSKTFYQTQVTCYGCGKKLGLR